MSVAVYISMFFLLFIFFASLFFIILTMNLNRKNDNVLCDLRDNSFVEIPAFSQSISKEEIQNQNSYFYEEILK